MIAIHCESALCGELVRRRTPLGPVYKYKVEVVTFSPRHFAMALVPLLLAALVLRAYSATIPSAVVPSVEEKLTEVAQKALSEETKIPTNQPALESATQSNEGVLCSSERDINQNQIQQNAAAKDENGPSNLKNVEEIEDDTLDALKLRNIQEEVSNPGSPQRQQHETQNPEYHSHSEQSQQIQSNISQTLRDVQDALSNGIQGVASGFQNLVNNNQQFSSIQQSIQSLHDSFIHQIEALNRTMHNIWDSQSANALQNIIRESQNKLSSQGADESSVKSIESSWKKSNDVHTVSVKAEDQSSTGGNVPANPFPGLSGYFQMFQNSITQGFANLTTALQSYVNQNQGFNNQTSNPGGLFQGFSQGLQGIINQNQNPPNNVQSDEGSPTPTRPSIWQGIQSSFQNIFNQGQSGQNSPNPPSGQISQAFQNNPFVQGVVNLIQPKPPGSEQSSQDPNKNPTKEPVQKPESENTGNSNPASTQTNTDQKLKPEESAQSSGSGIRQIIKKNPIFQSMAGAVQRIQTITNTDKPREVEIIEKAVPSQDNRDDNVISKV